MAGKSAIPRNARLHLRGIPEPLTHEHNLSNGIAYRDGKFVEHDGEYSGHEDYTHRFEGAYRDPLDGASLDELEAATPYDKLDPHTMAYPPEVGDLAEKLGAAMRRMPRPGGTPAEWLNAAKASFEGGPDGNPNTVVLRGEVAKSRDTADALVRTMDEFFRYRLPSQELPSQELPAQNYVYRRMFSAWIMHHIAAAPAVIPSNYDMEISRDGLFFIVYLNCIQIASNGAVVYLDRHYGLAFMLFRKADCTVVTVLDLAPDAGRMAACDPAHPSANVQVQHGTSTLANISEVTANGWAACTDGAKVGATGTYTHTTSLTRNGAYAAVFQNTLTSA